MAHDDHHYTATVQWRGNQGAGTRGYDTYGRQFVAAIEGKPPLQGSADPAFRGDPGMHNPEDLLLVALSSCHMLSYLALCARHRIAVVAYSDHAEGVMRTRPDGSGQFTEVRLRPRVLLQDGRQLERAAALHEHAHRLCFIANSCNFPITHQAVVEVLEETTRGAEGAEQSQ